MPYIVPAPDEISVSRMLFRYPFMHQEWGATASNPQTVSSNTEISSLQMRTIQQRRILIVDDDDWIRDILERILIRHHYQVFTAPSAEIAWEMLRFAPFDLIISDMMMSGMNGLDLITRVSQAYPHIPIILITAHSDTDLMRMAIRCGAADFLAKPFSIEDIPLVIERNLERHAIRSAVSKQHEDAVGFTSVKVLAAAIDAKEPFTAQHSRRVTRLAMTLGRSLQINTDELRSLGLAAQVHDVGKIGIPDHVLNKPGKLTDGEWELVRKHPEKGAEIVGQVKQLSYVADVVKHHHERVDGGGYPDALRGDNIPLLSRIISVVDAYEVMTADRVYRKHLTREEACHRLVEAAGSQFDTAVVNTFLSIPPETLLS